MFRRILCATDGSKRSAHAVKTAAALAHGSGALLTLVHVTPDYRTPYYPDGVMIDWPSEKDYKRDCKAAAEKVFAKDAAARPEGGRARPRRCTCSATRRPTRSWRPPRRPRPT